MNTSYSLTDKDLLERLAAGDETIFKLLFDRHYIALLFYARDILSDKSEAQDTVQEVFCRLWEKRPDFSSLSHLKSFLYKSTRFACIDRLRNRERRDARYETLLDLAMDDALQNSRMVEEELYAQVMAEIDQLPEKYATILKLKYVHQLDYSEIAGQLSISEAAVRKQKQRALELLKTRVLKKQLLSLALLYAFLDSTHV